MGQTPEHHIHSGAALLSVSGAQYVGAYRLIDADTEDVALPLPATLITISFVSVTGAYPTLTSGSATLTLSVTPSGHCIYSWGGNHLELIPFDGQLRQWISTQPGGAAPVSVGVRAPAVDDDAETNALLIVFTK